MNFLKPKFWDEKPKAGFWIKISILSFFLLPVSLFLQFLNFLKTIFIKKHTSKIPVICVGNIYLGGTGKTPLSIEIYLILKKLNKNPAFVRKKYNSYQDETSLQRLIGPVFENKKRIEAINSAAKNSADIVILDDGFQDFSIKKDLSIVCFNKTKWLGNGLTIPAGPLRENLSALKRANLVVINGNEINKENKPIMEKKILEQNRNIKIFYSKYKSINIDEFKNKKIISFAGIGNPVNFFELLKINNIDLLEEIVFPDHYNYSNMELEGLIDKSLHYNTILLTTQKDYLRINKKYRKNIRYLKIKIEIEKNDDFVEEIRRCI